MKTMYDFELLAEQPISELKTHVQLFRHKPTGAELLSLANDDTNKVFGITFRTPPADSTGIAHILEHSVLCGSRKYPVKEPFVELLKGSLQTFLNAFTFPDKTCYPVASQNLKDFYNLVDVYLDAVFFPRITPDIFQQEGWHYELDNPDGILSYKGVVYNEMKGAYSSPENLLALYSQQSLFPDNTYGLDSGGDPCKIPELSYGQFKEFHQRYYHPSNCRIYFYGDDDPQERLRCVHEYIKNFDGLEPDSAISLQPLFSRPRKETRRFPSGANETQGRKGMLTVNFLLEETTDIAANLACTVLEYILLGMPASPLRKALIDSGLGDGLAGLGLESDLRQMYFSTGLKGIDCKNAEKIETLILESLSTLANKGIDQRTVEAAMNTIEFRLRENHSGTFPRGLLLMIRILKTWLYGGDPFKILAFEVPLRQLKAKLQANNAFFAELLSRFFVQNPHRSTVTLKPDSRLAQKTARQEQERIQDVRSSMTAAKLQNIVETARKLRQLQQTPDSSEALATIPRLQLSEIRNTNMPIPRACYEAAGTQLLYHDLFTSGIFYCDVGLNLHVLPAQYLPYAPLFGRALLEMGTEKQDFVSLSQLISQKTGGIKTALFTSGIQSSDDAAAWLFLRGKAMGTLTPELITIFSEVLHSARFDDQTRFKQILLEEKAKQEQNLIPHGHQIVARRLRAHFNEACRADEAMSGLSYLFFLRELEKRVSADWKEIRHTLEDMRRILLGRSSMIINITADRDIWSEHESVVHEFLHDFPEQNSAAVPWTFEPLPACEGLMVPSQVNYVGKGVNLYELGYRYKGCIHVITHFLRNSWLWEQVRVQGGAYGAFCRFDRLSGVLTFVSYRDPNLMLTLTVFDQTVRFLNELTLQDAELTKSIIGAIGEIDTYMLPDEKGYTSIKRFLNGNTDDLRQQMREEILGTSADDFKEFADCMREFATKGLVKVLGSEQEILTANKNHAEFLHTFHVL